MKNLPKIKERVRNASERIFERQSFVSAIDVFLEMKWLHISHVRAWEKGDVPYLEKMIQGNPKNIRYALTCFRDWAQEEGLEKRKAIYAPRTIGPETKLHFTEDKNPGVEQAYRTHYTDPVVSEKIEQNHLEKTINGPAFFRLLAARKS